MSYAKQAEVSEEMAGKIDGVIAKQIEGSS